MARIPGTSMYLRPAALALMLSVAVIFGVVLGPSLAGAANGDSVVLGADNYEESTTRIDTSATNGSQALIVYSGPGAAIEADSSSGAGLLATTNGSTRSAVEARGEASGLYAYGDTVGVYAESGHVGVKGVTTDGGEGVVGDTWDDHLAGVHGNNHFDGPGVYGENRQDGDGVYGTTNTELGSGVSGLNTGDGPGVQGENRAKGNGVVGLANNPFASGVYGQNDGNGYGVAGRSNTGVGLFGDSANGTAVFANSPSGVALNVQGAMITNRAGVTTVPAGKNRVNQSVPNITGNALVLATVQGPKGKVWVMSATVTQGVHGFITIYLNANAPSDTRVGWFVLN